MIIVEYLFFICLLGAGFSYFIYPLLLLPFQGRNNSLKFKKKVSIDQPFLSFIITVYNEENNIEQKILNTLDTEYSPGSLEILIASDASTDKTNEIVKNYTNRGVRLIDVTDRMGKENAQLHAIRKAKGEILVFSDVSTRIEKGALHRIANVFEDRKIGAVSSEDRFITSDGKIAGEGAYVKYEMWLRKLESSANSLVGLSGSFFACRSSICKDWDILVPSDFNTAINSIRNGYIAVTDPELLGYYPTIKDDTREFHRKVRTVLRGITALFHNVELLNPIKYGFFSFQLFSHKLMRWLVPWFMLLILFINLLLLDQHMIYRLVLLGQALFYLTAFAGYLYKPLRNNKVIKIVYFFVQVNLAIAQAMIMYVTGNRITRWEPSKR